MKCPNCGAEIESGKFCEYCGAQLSSEMLKEQEKKNLAMGIGLDLHFPVAADTDIAQEEGNEARTEIRDHCGCMGSLSYFRICGKVFR